MHDPLNMQVAHLQGTYKPLFFSTKNADETKSLAALIGEQGNFMICDTIVLQLTELIKIKHPDQKLTKIQIENLIQEHLDGIALNDYGVWVYYPWLNKLVHTLDKEDFITVRTNRNMYKMLPDEIKKLSSKKIGIIGLSVGQAIALTAATERICGEMHLADFDNVELSNMNRLNAGIQDIGTSKVILAARKIAELDPYIKITCFTDGATPENIEAFFNDNGKIDILVEECDSIDVKIFSRLKARALGVPVVMDTNDNGMIDIERFDLESTRPVLHGRIPELEEIPAGELIGKLGALTLEEKIGYLARMIGMENVSKEMLASLGEMNRTITGWPQLASAVNLGGAVITDVCRRILLQKLNASGRYFVNLEQLIQ